MIPDTVNTVYDIYGFLSTFRNDLSSQFQRTEVQKKKGGYFQYGLFHASLCLTLSHTITMTIQRIASGLFVQRIRVCFGFKEA